MSIVSKNIQIYFNLDQKQFLTQNTEDVDIINVVWRCGTLSKCEMPHDPCPKTSAAIKYADLY